MPIFKLGKRIKFKLLFACRYIIDHAEREITSKNFYFSKFSVILTSLSFLNIIFFVCIIQIFEFFSCQLVHLSGQDKLQIPIVLSRRNILNDIIHHNSTNCNTNFSADSRNSFSLAAKKPLHLGVTAFRYKPFTSVF